MNFLGESNIFNDVLNNYIKTIMVGKINVVKTYKSQKMGFKMCLFK